MNIPDALPVLSKGHHRWGSGKACLMDAISWLSGKPEEGDAPSCVHPVFQVIGTRVNDLLDDPERHVLWRLVPDLIGTATDDPMVACRLALRAARFVEHYDLTAKKCNDVTERFLDEDKSSGELIRAMYSAYSTAMAPMSALASRDAGRSAAYAARAASATPMIAIERSKSAVWSAFTAICAYYEGKPSLAPRVTRLLDALVEEYKRITDSRPRDVTDEEWRELAEVLGC